MHVRQFSPIRGAQPGDTTPRRYQEAREDLTTDYFWIFPNWMLNCYPDNVSLNIVLPVEAERSLAIFEWYLPEKDHGSAGGEGLGGVQRPDSDRRCRHLRNRSEKSALPELFPRALQREAGKRRACVSPHVWQIHAAVTLPDIRMQRREQISTGYQQITYRNVRTDCRAKRGPRFWGARCRLRCHLRSRKQRLERRSSPPIGQRSTSDLFLFLGLASGV